MDVMVVESPAKAKTIGKYLGPGFTVLASYGHVRDLPPKDGSVRPDEDFAMDWEVDSASQKRVDAIAKAVTKGGKLFLATDPDREGEAISWHVLDILNRKKALQGVEVKRVTFNSITKQSVLDAVAHPRDLDQPLIDAYLARRALDYLVGFNLSPVLWRKLPGSRSAGRVQSVALRLICERESEIEVFKSREYWTVDALFGTAKKADAEGPPHPPRRPQARQVRHRHRRARRAGQEGDRAPRLLGGLDRPPPGAAQPAAAVHHLDPAAGSLAQAGRRRRHRDAHRPEALRRRRHRRRDGRPHHLYAYRRRAARAGGDRPDPPPDRDQVRPELRAGAAARLHLEGQERPGSARSDPPDRPLPPAAGRGAVPRQGPARSLRADLEAHRRQPDGKRRARPGDGRYRQRRQDRAAAHHRLGREVPRLPHALRREARTRRPRTTRTPPSCPTSRKPRRSTAARSFPNSISPSRRRAIRKRAWSRSWKSSASAGPRPTPRSSRCCSAATT